MFCRASPASPIRNRRALLAVKGGRIAPASGPIPDAADAAVAALAVDAAAVDAAARAAAVMEIAAVRAAEAVVLVDTAAVREAAGDARWAIVLLVPQAARLVEADGPWGIVPHGPQAEALDEPPEIGLHARRMAVVPAEPAKADRRLNRRQGDGQCAERHTLCACGPVPMKE